MYRPTPSVRDRAGPLVAVTLIHVGIGFALLHLTGVEVELVRQADLAIFDISEAPPPPPPPPPPPSAQNQSAQKKPKRDEGAAAPPNIESRATPVEVPPPRVLVPAAPPIVAAITASTGAAPTQGASPVVGPGTGAGGTGTGAGSGGSGAGGGGGGAGGNGLGEARARLVTPLLSRRDFSPALYRQAPRGGTVFMVLRVGPDGIPVSCRVTRSFGDTQIDAETCRLAVARLRFSPGRDDQGRPVPDFFGYQQQFNTRY